MVRYLNLLALGAAMLTAGAPLGLAPVQAQSTPATKAVHVSNGSTTPVPYAESTEAQVPGVRVATFNASLNRTRQGQLARDLASPSNRQARAVAEIVQRTAPDILLLNEFDYDAAGQAAQLFKKNYLSIPQRGQPAIDYPYMYLAPSNTGIPSGADLNSDGIVGGPGDALGYGDFEGQFAMVLYSKYPIDTGNVRTFQKFLWKDMPDSQLPADYYDDLVRGVLRLPSKSMWDVPVSIGDTVVHLIASHPTPPVFDGPEQRNKRRNHDEIRLLNDYITVGTIGGYIYDDRGIRGPLKRGSKFVVLGDLNSDSTTGDSDPRAIKALRQNPLLVDPLPASQLGKATQTPRLGRDDVVLDVLSTANFGRGASGMMRVDYVLPSAALPVRAAGVYWPGPGQGGSDLVGGWPPRSSDHRLVWVNLDIPE